MGVVVGNKATNLTILLMANKKKTSGISYFFTLKSGFNFSSSLSKVQTLWDVQVRMVLFGALLKKLQLHKRHVLMASKSMSTHISGKQVRSVPGKELPMSLTAARYPL